MPRRVPADRVDRLLAAAAAAFVENGYHHTQMDHVATRLGTSKGTLYRTVDAKESLFVAVVDHSGPHGPLAADAFFDDRDLRGAADRLLARLVAEIEASAVGGALRREEPLADRHALATEVTAVATDLYVALAAERVGVMVVDRCAPELPAMADVWFGAGRYALVDGLTLYLERYADLVTGDVPLAMLARTIAELVTMWAVKMPWDPAPRPAAGDPATACAAMVRNLVMGDDT